MLLSSNYYVIITSEIIRKNLKINKNKKQI